MILNGVKKIWIEQGLLVEMYLMTYTHMHCKIPFITVTGQELIIVLLKNGDLSFSGFIDTAKWLSDIDPEKTTDDWRNGVWHCSLSGILSLE